MQKANNGPIRMVGFTAHGRKQSFEPTTDFNGVIRSDLTNEETPLLLIAQSDPAERQPELRQTLLHPCLPRQKILMAFRVLQNLTSQLTIK